MPAVKGELPKNLGDVFEAPDGEPAVAGGISVSRAKPAPTTKKAKAKPKAAKAEGMPNTVKIQLEDNAEIPPTGLFVGHNGMGYLIRVGEPVDVPDFVVDLLENAVMALPVMDPNTQQVIAYRERMRYPFRRM